MGPAIVGCPVKVSVAAQDDSAASVRAVRTPGLGTKTVNRSQRPARSHSEDRSLVLRPTGGCRPVEVSVVAQHGPDRIVAVLAKGITHDAKAVERRQRPGWRDLEDRAAVSRPSSPCCPVKVSVGVRRQRIKNCRTVSAARNAAKVVEAGERSTGSDLEYCAAANAETLSQIAAEKRCSVKVAAADLHHSVTRIGAVRAVEAVQRNRGSTSCELEERAMAERSAAARYAIKVSVCTQPKGARAGAVGASCHRAEVVKHGEGSGWSQFEQNAGA